MDVFLKIVGSIVVFFGILVLVAVLMAIPMMLLWNWLMPFLFGLPTVGFWEALGISLLSGCLFRHSSCNCKKSR